MRLNNLRNKKWYPNAVAACIAVTLFVVLTHLGSISKALRTVTGYFSPVFLGLVLAYLINPLARMYQRTLFRRIRRQGVRWSLSIALAVLTVMIFLIYFAGTLVPQLVDSATGFIGNLDDYAASLQKRLEGWEPAESLGLNKLLASYEDGVNILVNYLNDNLTSILNLSLAAGNRYSTGLSRCSSPFMCWGPRKSCRRAFPGCCAPRFPKRGMTASCAFSLTATSY